MRIFLTSNNQTTVSPEKTGLLALAEATEPGLFWVGILFLIPLIYFLVIHRRVKLSRRARQQRHNSG